MACAIHGYICTCGSEPRRLDDGGHPSATCVASAGASSRQGTPTSTVTTVTVRCFVCARLLALP